MTEQEQRIAIAEALGVVCKRCKGTGKYLRYGKHEWFRVQLSGGAPKIQPEISCDHTTYDPTHHFAQLLPDYLHDLNACREMVSSLNCLEQNQFAVELLRVLGISPDEPTEPSEMFEFCNATAAQRAEAFLKTKGLWK